MAARKEGLAAQVESIVSEAAESVRNLVRESLKREIGALLGAGLGGGGDAPVARKKPGPKPGARKKAGRKPGPKPGARKAKKPAAKAAPKAGKKASKKAGGRAKRGELGEKAKLLGKLVSDKGELAPGDARAALKLNPVQMANVARQAAAEGLIKTTGKGRGTRYLKV